jgi:ribonuclease-3
MATTQTNNFSYDDWLKGIDALCVNLGLVKPGEKVNEYTQANIARALTHSSYSYEQRQQGEAWVENYERLEFLGDAVLKLLVSEYLFERFPDYREGELTKIRAVVVSDAMLAEFAADLGLGDLMRFGPNEAKQGGRKKMTSLACGFEALLGAMFLAGHLPEARQLLLRYLDDAATRVDADPTKNNYKATLQEFTQGEGLGLPEYRVIEQKGPAHKRMFTVEVTVADKVMGRGTGRSKKEAQQTAAMQAVEALEI